MDILPEWPQPLSQGVRQSESSPPTKRHQVLDPYGRIVSNQYDYPEGYQMPPGQGRITGDGRGILRVASIRHDIAAT